LTPQLLKGFFLVGKIAIQSRKCRRWRRWCDAVVVEEEGEEEAAEM